MAATFQWMEVHVPGRRYRPGQHALPQRT